MRKLITAGVVLLCLSGCSQNMGDLLLKTYSGPAVVLDQNELKKQCTLKIRMLKNGFETTITRSGKESCPEAEGSLIFFVGGMKI